MGTWRQQGVLTYWAHSCTRMSDSLDSDRQYAQQFFLVQLLPYSSGKASSRPAIIDGDCKIFVKLGVCVTY